MELHKYSYIQIVVFFPNVNGKRHKKSKNLVDVFYRYVAGKTV